MLKQRRKTLSKEVWKSNFRQYGEMKKQSAGRRVRREKIRRKKMQVREKVGKSRNTVFSHVFSWFCGSGGLKSRLAKAAGAETSGEMRDEKLHAVVARSTFGKIKMLKTEGFGPLLEVEMLKKCTPLWREAHFEVKMYITHQLRTTFGSWDVEKVHAVVARSTFRSQNVQNTPASDHFWKLRCRKSARRCGAKHISKSKCTKHTRSGPLLAVEMSKKCTPLWREAHFKVKMYKTLGVRTTFGGSDVASLRFGSLHYTIHSTTLQYITLHYTPQHYTYNYRTTQLHSTTFHYIKLQYTTPHYTTLHYTTLHYTTLYTPLHYTTLHYTTLYTPHTTVHYTTLHSTTLQLQNYTTTLHYTPLHTATLNYTTLHYTTLERSIDR